MKRNIMASLRLAAFDLMELAEYIIFPLRRFLCASFSSRFGWTA